MSDNKYGGPFSSGSNAPVWLAVIAFVVIIAVISIPNRQDTGHELQAALSEGYRDYRLKAFASDKLPHFRPQTSEEWTVFCQNWTEEAGCDLLAEVGFPFSRIEVEEQCEFEQEALSTEGSVPLNKGLRGTWRQFDPTLEPAAICAAYGFHLSS